MYNAAKLMALVSCGALIILSPTQATAGPKKVKVGEPVQYAGAETIAQSAELVQVSAKADFSAVKRVVIPYFQVEVQSKGGANASSKGFMSKMRNNVSVTYTIDGVDHAAIQALTDKLYGDLIAAFKARGIEVIDRADARARSKNYAKIEAAYQLGPKETGLAGGGKSMFYAPSGMGLYFVGIENTGNGKTLGLGGLGGALSGFSQVGNTMAEFYTLTELDAAIVGVRLKVAFVETESFKMDGFVSLSHKAAISIQPIDSQLWIMAPGTQTKKAGVRVQYQLSSPIIPSVDPIISVDDTMSTGKKIDTAVGNLIGGLTGTSSYKVEQYTIRLDPAKFASAMGPTMAGTQALLIDSLKKAPLP